MGRGAGAKGYKGEKGGSRDRDGWALILMNTDDARRTHQGLCLIPRVWVKKNRLHACLFRYLGEHPAIIEHGPTSYPLYPSPTITILIDVIKGKEIMLKPKMETREVEVGGGQGNWLVEIVPFCSLHQINNTDIEHVQFT